ncbi:hypothetical protein DMN31_04395 [Clostridium perfringens]|nr:hypothetical protein [Clostridium perfringens]WEV15648.1 HEPN domain-containing protein [Clostridium perfringens D]
MDNFTVEYLIKVEGNEGFCDSTESFNNLLKINSNIKIENNTIIYDRLNINFKNLLYNVEKNIFDISFSINNDDIDKINIFEKFLRCIKEILNKISPGEIQVLWDDISLYYSKKAYPIINDIETLMRKLLTKFMTIKVGENWDKENIPEKVAQSIKSKDSNKCSYGYFYNANFIDLSYFLFNGYRNKNTDNLIKAIDCSEGYEIEDYIKKSNWERYFNTVVECEEKELRKKWEKLYELRCKVAHNNLFTRTDLENCKNLAGQVRIIIEKAMENFDKIVIKPEEKKILIDNLSYNFNEGFGEFIRKFQKMDLVIRRLSEISLNERSNKRAFYENYRRLVSEGIIEDEKLKKLMEDVRKTRNLIVHSGDLEITSVELTNLILGIDYIIKELESITNDYNNQICKDE